MRLKKLDTGDGMTSLQLRVRQSTANMLEAYRQHYTATYQEDIKVSQLSDTMLRDFMESDKDFMKAYKQKS